jgi:hypothetical protein
MLFFSFYSYSPKLFRGIKQSTRLNTTVDGPRKYDLRINEVLRYLSLVTTTTTNLSETDSTFQVLQKN